MSGGNNIPRFAKWNRENEFAPLRYRGVIFHSPDEVQVTASATLTPDQVMSNIFSFTSGTLTWPSTTDVLTNLSPNGLLSQYNNNNATSWMTTVLNVSGGNITLSFPGSWSVSPTFSLTVLPNEVRQIHYRIGGLGNILVY